MNEIINEIYQDEYYDQMIKKITSNKYKYTDDIKQELFMFLLNKPEELIIELYNDGDRLKRYCYTILSNMVNSKSSPFYCKYRKAKIEFEDNIEDHEHLLDINEETYNEKFNIYDYVVDNKILSWYEVEIFNLYYRIFPSFLEQDITKKISTAKIAEILNISKMNVMTQINKIKYKIFKKIFDDGISNTEFITAYISKYESKIKK